MWRLMLVAFLGLGWAYYEMSGGSDFRPASEMTVEERAALGLRTPSDEVLARLEEEAAEAAVQAEADAAAEAAEAAQQVQVSDTTTQSGGPALEQVVETVAAEPEQEIILPEAAFLVSAPAISAIGDAVAEASQQIEVFLPATPADIRRVSGSRVNMRSGPGTDYGVVTVLSQGEEAEVLEDLGNGWVRLRVVATGEEGYMAGRLLSAI